MEEFAHHENIERFRRELRREMDPARRALLEDLLKQELIQLERVQREKIRGL